MLTHQCCGKLSTLSLVNKKPVGGSLLGEYDRFGLSGIDLTRQFLRKPPIFYALHAKPIREYVMVLHELLSNGVWNHHLPKELLKNIDLTDGEQGRNWGGFGNDDHSDDSSSTTFRSSASSSAP